MKDKNGVIYENTYKVGGMYSNAIEQIIYWIEKAKDVAENEELDIIIVVRDLDRVGQSKQFLLHHLPVFCPLFVGSTSLLIQPDLLHMLTSIGLAFSSITSCFFSAKYVKSEPTVGKSRLSASTVT